MAETFESGRNPTSSTSEALPPFPLMDGEWIVGSPYQIESLYFPVRGATQQKGHLFLTPLRCVIVMADVVSAQVQLQDVTQIQQDFVLSTNSLVLIVNARSRIGAAWRRDTTYRALDVEASPFTDETGQSLVFQIQVWDPADNEGKLGTRMLGLRQFGLALEDKSADFLVTESAQADGHSETSPSAVPSYLIDGETTLCDRRWVSSGRTYRLRITNQRVLIQCRYRHHHVLRQMPIDCVKSISWANSQFTAEDRGRSPTWLTFVPVGSPAYPVGRATLHWAVRTQSATGIMNAIFAGFGPCLSSVAISRKDRELSSNLRNELGGIFLAARQGYSSESHLDTSARASASLPVKCAYGEEPRFHTSVNIANFLESCKTDIWVTSSRLVAIQRYRSRKPGPYYSWPGGGRVRNLMWEIPLTPETRLDLFPSPNRRVGLIIIKRNDETVEPEVLCQLLHPAGVRYRENVIPGIAPWAPGSSWSNPAYPIVPVSPAGATAILSPIQAAVNSVLSGVPTAAPDSLAASVGSMPRQETAETATNQDARHRNSFSVNGESRSDDPTGGGDATLKMFPQEEVLRSCSIRVGGVRGRSMLLVLTNQRIALLNTETKTPSSASLTWTLPVQVIRELHHYIQGGSQHVVLVTGGSEGRAIGVATGLGNAALDATGRYPVLTSQNEESRKVICDLGAVLLALRLGANPGKALLEPLPSEIPPAFSAHPLAGLPGESVVRRYEIASKKLVLCTNYRLIFFDEKSTRRGIIARSLDRGRQTQGSISEIPLEEIDAVERHYDHGPLVDRFFAASVGLVLIGTALLSSLPWSLGPLACCYFPFWHWRRHRHWAHTIVRTRARSYDRGYEIARARVPIATIPYLLIFPPLGLIALAAIAINWGRRHIIATHWPELPVPNYARQRPSTEPWPSSPIPVEEPGTGRYEMISMGPPAPRGVAWRRFARSSLASYVAVDGNESERFSYELAPVIADLQTKGVLGSGNAVGELPRYAESHYLLQSDEVLRREWSPHELTNDIASQTLALTSKRLVATRSVRVAGWERAICWEIPLTAEPQAQLCSVDTTRIASQGDRFRRLARFFFPMHKIGGIHILGPSALMRGVGAITFSTLRLLAAPAVPILVIVLGARVFLTGRPFPHPDIFLLGMLLVYIGLLPLYLRSFWSHFIGDVSILGGLTITSRGLPLPREFTIQGLPTVQSQTLWGTHTNVFHQDHQQFFQQELQKDDPLAVFLDVGGIRKRLRPPFNPVHAMPVLVGNDQTLAEVCAELITAIEAGRSGRLE